MTMSRLFQSHLTSIVSSFQCSLLSLSSFLHSISYRYGLIPYVLSVLAHPRLYTLIFGYILGFKLRLLKDRQIITIVWDYNTMPAKYGDYIFGLTVAKIIACFGFEVHFVEILSRHHTFYKKPGIADEPVVAAFIEQRDPVQRYFCNHENVRFILYQSFSDFINRIDSHGFIVCEHLIRRRRYVLHYYHNFISPLYRCLSKAAQSDFLSRRVNHRRGDHISTSLRRNLSRPEKDLPLDFFYEILACASTVLPLYICSDSSTLISLDASLISRLSPKYSVHSTYIEDIYMISSGAFYFQYRGGGVGGPVSAIMDIPFLISQVPGHIIPSGPRKFFAFNDSSQLFTSNLDPKFFMRELLLRLPLYA